MDNSKPNFGERVQTMREAAKKLRDIAELVATEVIHRARPGTWCRRRSGGVARKEPVGRLESNAA